MTERHLHIIAYDVPWPADYGGVVDLFYRIKALYAAGIKIHLHCFVYRRGKQDELSKYCEQVYYYKRHNDIFHFSFRVPFIVNSRKNKKLLANLSKDQHPILIEGVHCSYYLQENMLANRKILLRLHNTEFEYYHHLSLHESNPFKRFYYGHESRLLKNYETGLATKTSIGAISSKDVQRYTTALNATDIFYLPAFTPFEKVTAQHGKGCFCLYHGNLSINENEQAVTWLLNEVFDTLDIPLVIAGKDPSGTLAQLIKHHKNACLIGNPADNELQDMIAKAQINILPSFNNTGVKLKLLNALYNGRHCLVNKAGVEGSDLDRICQVAEEADEFKTAIGYLYNIPYEESENTTREEILNRLYNNRENLHKITSFFWENN